MFETSPSPEELARWLLDFEVREHQGAEGSTVGLEHVYVQLHTDLTVFFGKTGFESLWGRAMFRAKVTFPNSIDKQGVPLPILQSTYAVDEYATKVEGDIALLALTSFISLLFSFVGADLGARLIRQIWPEIPTGNQDMPTGATTL